MNIDYVDMQERIHADQVSRQEAADMEADNRFEWDHELVLKSWGKQGIVDLMVEKHRNLCLWFANMCMSFSEIPELDSMVREAKTFPGGIPAGFDELLHATDPVEIAYDLYLDRPLRNAISSKYSAGVYFCSICAEFMDRAIEEARKSWGDMQDKAMIELINRGQ